MKALFNRRQLELIRHALVTPANPDSADEVDLQLIDEVAPPFDWLCSRYYRLTIEGMDDVPYGPALMVGNHNSGTSFYEAILRPLIEDHLATLKHQRAQVANFADLVAYLQASMETCAYVMGNLHWSMVRPGRGLNWHAEYHELTGRPARPISTSRRCKIA